MLNHKDHLEKHLRAMHRELALLETRRRHPPVHELQPPIQRGWKRHFVLTSAARLRPDAETLTAILDALNTVQYFWRPDFRHTRRQSRRRRCPVAIEQELMAIHWRDWEKDPVPPTWRKYFHREFLPVERLRSWPRWTGTSYYHPWFVGASRHFDWGYAFRFGSWLELKAHALHRD